MGKGKTFTYLLIICVAAVWGLIIYRVYAGMSEEDPVLTSRSAKVSYFKMINHQDDITQLDLRYRDPFMATEGGAELNENKRGAPAIPALQQAQPLRAMVPKAQVNWSGIQYTGYINNPDSKQKMVLLSVNGNAAVLREGQYAHGLKLLKNLGDSLKVQFQGETKFIKIK